MANPVAYQILEAIHDRVAAISVASGYNTSPAVRMGQQTANVDEQECGPIINVFDIGDEVSDPQAYTNMSPLVSITVAVEAYYYTTEDASLWAHLIAQDIKTAVFTSDTRLGGLAMSVRQGPRQMLYPDSGSNTLGVRQNVIVIYRETYGNP